MWYRILRNGTYEGENRDPQCTKKDEGERLQGKGGGYGISALEATELGVNYRRAITQKWGRGIEENGGLSINKDDGTGSCKKKSIGRRLDNVSGDGA